MGERNAFLDAGLQEPVLYWIGPVWNAKGQAVGAILIGESVADIARGISGSSFYDGHGNLLSSTLPAARSLSQAVRQEVSAGQAIRVMEVRDGQLHDIGKIGIEDRVLHKPTLLNDEETGTMQEHPRIGYEMLKGLRFLQPSLAGVRHHHERWDGAGYPDGIAGSGIPLLVRILTVADVFDALTSERPYRRALSPEAATREIIVESGVRYDPDVVTAFVARRQAIAAIVRDVETKAS